LRELVVGHTGRGEKPNLLAERAGTSKFGSGNTVGEDWSTMGSSDREKVGPIIKRKENSGHSTKKRPDGGGK